MITSTIGWKKQASALKASRKAATQPRVRELSDGTYAGVLDNTIDSTGNVTGWLVLPSGVVRADKYT
jgi:hypothetical protein